MSITLDQAETLVAISKFGSLTKAAHALNKGHSALLYQIKALEGQLGFPVFNREGYRNSLTEHGKIVLKYSHELLSVRNELVQHCAILKQGIEPELRVIYDGVINFSHIATALSKLGSSTTEIKVMVAHLDEVETLMHQEKAQVALTIRPFKGIHSKNQRLQSLHLKPLKMRLVCHKSHPLAKCKKPSKKLLSTQTLIRIRSSSVDLEPLLGLSTDSIEFKSLIIVNDFDIKKRAIEQGLGFGWLPSYLLDKNYLSGQLVLIEGEIAYEHELTPILYYHSQIGPVAKKFIHQLAGI